MDEPIDPYGGQPYYGPPQSAGPPAYPSYQGAYPGYSSYPVQPVLPLQPGAAHAPRYPRRPGTTIASSVLAFVAGGLLILAAVVLFSSARFVHDIGEGWSSNTQSVTNELSVDGIINLCAAALLIPGGVLLLGGKAFGQSLVAIGSIVVVAATVYWVIRVQADYSGTIVFAALFGGLAVVSIALAYAPSSRAWITHVTAVNALLRTPPRQFD
jgi:hypothetical protein